MPSTQLDQLDARSLVTSLNSCRCPACGLQKKRGQTFCRTDYFALPRPMRIATYDRLGQGYQEAVAAAMAFLGKSQFLLPY